MAQATDRGFRPLAALDPGERGALRAVVGAHPVFRLYLESGLEAADAGDRSRSALPGRAGEGAVLSIDFDDVTVRTVVGRVAADELAAACTVPRRAELHVAPELRPAVAALCRGRMLADQSIRYYVREVAPGAEPDPRCRRLGTADHAALAGFFRTHHPATIFSAWMRDETLVGLFEDGELVACGGVIVRHVGLGTANLGNFVTVPRHRGRGLARAVMRTLLSRLAEEGIRLATLGATAENEAACRSYEAVGFRLLEERAELVVGPG